MEGGKNTKSEQKQEVKQVSLPPRAREAICIGYIYVVKWHFVTFKADILPPEILNGAKEGNSLL